jgi:hypothetical protein
MTPRFDAIILGLIFGTATLSVTIPKARANELELTQETSSVCQQNPSLQTSSSKRFRKTCQSSDNSEKQVSDERIPNDNLDDPTNEKEDNNPADSVKDRATSENQDPNSNDSDRDPVDVDTDNSGDKGTPDKSKEESEPASTSDDSHDFNLFKGNIIFQINPGSGGDSFGNGFTSPEPMQPETPPIKPSKKVPKKVKDIKLQKLVSPKSPNPNRLLPQKSINSIIPKTPSNIKSLIVPTKSVRPILSRPAPALRIRSVQPMMKQNPMINRGMSRPVQRRSK